MNSNVAQGGTCGSLVTNCMGTQETKGLLAIHTNMPEVTARQ